MTRNLLDEHFRDGIILSQVSPLSDEQICRHIAIFCSRVFTKLSETRVSDLHHSMTGQANDSFKFIAAESLKKGLEETDPSRMTEIIFQNSRIAQLSNLLLTWIKNNVAIFDNHYATLWQEF